MLYILKYLKCNNCKTIAQKNQVWVKLWKVIVKIEYFQQIDKSIKSRVSGITIKQNQKHV